MQLGELLNDAFPQQKPEVGVVTAGGIARTYQGPVFDMLGLSSVKIAHADRHRTGLKNHAAFSSSVFYETLPGAVAPRVISDQATMKTAAFNDGVTHRLFYDAEFQAKYVHVELRLRNRAHVWNMLSLPTSDFGRWMASTPDPLAGFAVFVRRDLVNGLNREVFVVAVTEYKAGTNTQ